MQKDKNAQTLIKFYQKMKASGIPRIPKNKKDQLRLLAFYNRRTRENHPEYKPEQLKQDKLRYKQEYTGNYPELSPEFLNYLEKWG
jgi:hypothetical protein